MKSLPTVVVDNGAATIKAGLTDGDSEPRLVANAVVRSRGDKTTYFGHEFERCRDYSSLHFRLPFEKGYLVDWDAQKAVWDGLFSAEVLSVNAPESSLLITEPYFNLPNVQDVYDQFVFEEYEFHSYYRCTPASLIPRGDMFTDPFLAPPECMLLVDAGFSFTHVVPILNGSIVWSAVKRIDVGGKLLTNHLKELTSFRQWNMMDETYIMNNVKESCCFISTNYNRDLETCRLDPKKNAIVQEYILPDFATNREGRIRRQDDIVSDGDQILFMNNERFVVPEIIFRPDDIGLQQVGLPATIAHSISLLPEDIQGLFWANIGLIGGSTKFPGFRERLAAELRSLAPVDCEVAIYQSQEPITECYRSALAFVQEPDFQEYCVTRAEYLESGSNACRRKFKDWKLVDEKGKGAAVREPAKPKPRTEDPEESDASPPPKRGGRGRTRTTSTSTRKR
ncbi:hypothetical protein JAAARDRAFT_122230 [Jaapia argillacea MUCL 33604]|uniref:Actin-like protein ARP6 n=1 Tax=Jaapia argillacea MUCL 33604 TaxID=933084 RepID=A0A067QH16_9AGAM|nr:hypothetical protein JAAARDRAFT_122230 [Jaapia argillacea MUCL 33604]